MVSPPANIEAAAAAATFLLAGATVWLGWQARRAAQEAARARLDQLGPAVVVREAFLELTPLARDAVGSGEPSIDALLALAESQFGDMELGVRCLIFIVNEGGRTAVVRVTTPADTVLEGFRSGEKAGGGLSTLEPLPQRGSWWVLGPGITGQLALVTWKSMTTWAAAARNEQECPVTEVKLECMAEPASVLDTCSVTYQKSPLWPSPTGEMVIVTPMTIESFPNPPPEDVVKITQMVRRYPT